MREKVFVVELMFVYENNIKFTIIMNDYFEGVVKRKIDNYIKQIYNIVRDKVPGNLHKTPSR